MLGFVGAAAAPQRIRRHARMCTINATPAKRALLLVDHGSRRKEANEMLDDVRNMVVELGAGVDIVETAHMELADPNIAQGIGRCVQQGAEEVVVMPYFLAPGRHSSKDIPEMVGEAAKEHPEVKISVASPLGVHRKIGEVILERAGLGASG
mmetsp:Transcript_8941/g.26851  ORF Transcript_8941/g.26851 Transcript_8941/m.26851 type:complete len:152 (+) Transcript_8941:72-527(+)